MNVIDFHDLTIYRNPVGIGLTGVCSCSDPDYDGGWSGQVEFHEFSKDSVREAHFNHILEVAA